MNSTNSSFIDSIPLLVPQRFESGPINKLLDNRIATWLKNGGAVFDEKYTINLVEMQSNGRLSGELDKTPFGEAFVAVWGYFRQVGVLITSHADVSLKSLLQKPACRPRDSAQMQQLLNMVTALIWAQLHHVSHPKEADLLTQWIELLELEKTEDRDMLRNLVANVTGSLIGRVTDEPITDQALRGILQDMKSSIVEEMKSSIVQEMKSSMGQLENRMASIETEMMAMKNETASIKTEMREVRRKTDELESKGRRRCSVGRAFFRGYSPVSSSKRRSVAKQWYLAIDPRTRLASVGGNGVVRGINALKEREAVRCAVILKRLAHELAWVASGIVAPAANPVPADCAGVVYWIKLDRRDGQVRCDAIYAGGFWCRLWSALMNFLTGTTRRIAAAVHEQICGLPEFVEKAAQSNKGNQGRVRPTIIDAVSRNYCISPSLEEELNGDKALSQLPSPLAAHRSADSVDSAERRILARADAWLDELRGGVQISIGE